MIVGKWSRSVWLSYAGVASSCIGIFLSIVEHKYNFSCICLIFAGICDLLDGFIARRDHSRKTEDHQFGIELDSLADSINFIALPVVILCSMDMQSLCEIIPIVMFSVCGVARLAYFNTYALKTHGAVPYYRGLPVTYTALIIPVCFLAFDSLIPSLTRELLLIVITIIGVFNILDIRIAKPAAKIYWVFIVLAIVVSVSLGLME